MIDDAGGCESCELSWHDMGVCVPPPQSAVCTYSSRSWCYMPERWQDSRSRLRLPSPGVDCLRQHPTKFFYAAANSSLSIIKPWASSPLRAPCEHCCPMRNCHLCCCSWGCCHRCCRWAPQCQQASLAVAGHPCSRCRRLQHCSLCRHCCRCLVRQLVQPSGRQ